MKASGKPIVSGADRMTISHQTSVFEPGGDPRALRNALGRFATGVTVVTTRCASGKLEGLTANSFSAVSLDPPLVLWSLRKAAGSLQSFAQAPHFAVNVLAADQHEVSTHFARSAPDKFASVAFDEGVGGCPVIQGALATFECSVETQVEGGDHIIFIGRVHRATYRDGEPLIFAGGAYCRAERLVLPG
jgi:flavin reductase (DIM6/NTAB) family NADH-FMN oxidoreductase RutF